MPDQYFAHMYLARPGIHLDRVSACVTAVYTVVCTWVLNLVLSVCTTCMCVHTHVPLHLDSTDVVHRDARSSARSQPWSKVYSRGCAKPPRIKVQLCHSCTRVQTVQLYCLLVHGGLAPSSVHTFGSLFGPSGHAWATLRLTYNLDPMFQNPPPLKSKI